MAGINNSTIAKLNRKEIAELDLYNRGIYTFKGALKSRKQGFKTVKVNEYQTNFVGEAVVIEFISIVPLGDEPEYAMRVKNVGEDDYLQFYPVLWGIDFVK